LDIGKEKGEKEDRQSVMQLQHDDDSDGTPLLPIPVTICLSQSLFANEREAEGGLHAPTLFCFKAKRKSQLSTPMINTISWKQAWWKAALFTQICKDLWTVRFVWIGGTFLLCELKNQKFSKSTKSFCRRNCEIRHLGKLLTDTYPCSWHRHSLLLLPLLLLKA
jgi:hypothetical protein